MKSINHKLTDVVSWELIALCCVMLLCRYGRTDNDVSELTILWPFFLLVSNQTRPKLMPPFLPCLRQNIKTRLSLSLSVLLFLNILEIGAICICDSVLWSHFTVLQDKRSYQNDYNKLGSEHLAVSFFTFHSEPPWASHMELTGQHFTQIHLYQRVLWS